MTRRDDRDFADEIRSHLEHETDRLIAAGVVPAEAHAAARRKFGNVTRTAEIRHESRQHGIHMKRLRLAVRRLRRASLFTIGVVTMLGLTVAAATLVFGAVYVVALRPLPFKDPGHLVLVWSEDDTRLGAQSQDVFDDDVLRIWRAGQTSFSAFSAYASISLMPHSRISGRIGASRVDGLFFSTLGIGTALGRPITPGDDDAASPPVMVLSDPLWHRAFGGDPTIIGTTWRLNTTAYTIVGVAPTTADIPGGEAWVSAPGRTGGSTGDHYVGLARLKPGVPVGRAQAELDALVLPAVNESPDASRHGAMLVPLAQSLRHVDQTLILLIAAVALLVAVALANLGTLFLVRTLGRLKQTAISIALGATTSRLRTDAAIEGLLLGIGAAIVGAAIVAWARTALQPFISDQVIGRPGSIPLGVVVLGFALAFAVAAGVVLAVLPERITRYLDLTEYLRGGGAGSGITRAQSRWRRGLVGLQVASAVIAAVAAVALLRSVRYLAHIDVGYDATQIIVAPLDLENTEYQSSDRTRELVPRIDAALAHVPGLTAPAIWTALGFAMPKSSSDVMMTAEGSQLRMDMNHCNWSKCAFVIEPVTGNFFATFPVPVKAGRVFDESDRAGSAPVAIINRRAAQVWWPGEDVIGKRIRLGGEASSQPWRTIVGVVADIAPLSGMGPLIRAVKPSTIQPVVYEPLAQADLTNPIGGSAGLFVGVRAMGPRQGVELALRQRLAALLPDIQLSPPMPMQEFLHADDYTAALLDLHTAITVAVTAVTLLLAILGIAGVVAESVRHRTRELGVRQALGATKGNIIRLICGSALHWLGTGVAAGVVATLLLRGIIARVVFRASTQFPDGLLQFGPTHHVVILMLTTLAILVIGLAAAYVPARLAAGLDPLVALRSGNE